MVTLIVWSPLTKDVPMMFLNYLTNILSLTVRAFLEEIDVWFSSRKDKNPGPEPRKETGLYMVHYVEDEGELVSLRDLLKNRGLEQDN